MGNGRTKEYEDPVTHRLCHIALIAMHRFHHELQRGINEGRASSGSSPLINAATDFSLYLAVTYQRARFALER